MRAVLLQDGALRVDEIPSPEPGPGEVLVDVLACGICGSDLHCAKHGPEFNAAFAASVGAELMDLSGPVVFGHEFVGRITAHGPGTQGTLPVGQRVVSIAALLREQPRFIGFCGPDVPGGYAEQMLLSEPVLLPVPDHLDDEAAAMTEPLSVGYRAVSKADLRPDDVPLVVGCGPIGLAVIAVLKMRGVGPIVAADFSAGRRDLAARLGADIVVDPAEASAYESWAQAAATDDPERMGAPTAVLGQLPMRPTVAFECVGVPGMIQQVIAGSPAGTRIVVAGLCMQSDSFQPAEAIIKEVDLRFALMYTPDQFTQTFRHLCDGDIDVSALISASIGLDEVPSTFEKLASAPMDAKVLIRPSAREYFPGQ